ncbi:MAG: carbohydrate kinase family protein [Zoogloeaceae bacterium]|jgi:adenosine kinase|nr:carbohydrate kinase family protein [Zoogloeaceae bacterium]
MSANILVCGSVAYDTVMVFPGRFKEHILPEQIHLLNVSFLAPEMRREFGGCAGNIAHTLKLLGASPLIMATVGEDAGPYFARLEERGISRTHIREIPGSYTAQAFVTTDLDDNQITAFHPGAMMFSHENHVDDVPEAALAIVAPDGRDGMLQHVRDLARRRVPFVFDPGQGLPLFRGEELLECLALADYAAFNDYEIRLTAERTGRTVAQLAGEVEALIVTKGGEGSEIHVAGECLQIPAAPPAAIVDPTGCGDAYRAGLLYGILHRWDWRTTGQLAALLGALKIETQGPQNHVFDPDKLADRYRQAFGETLRQPPAGA